MIETKEYMSAPVITADASATILELARIMNEHNIGCIVITRNDELAGIVTERDIVRQIVSQDKNPARVTANDIMTTDVHTAHVDASVMEISGEMKANNMRRLIIVDDEEQPIGIVTSRDLIGLLV